MFHSFFSISWLNFHLKLPSSRFLLLYKPSSGQWPCDRNVFWTLLSCRTRGKDGILKKEKNHTMVNQHSKSQLFSRCCGKGIIVKKYSNTLWCLATIWLLCKKNVSFNWPLVNWCLLWIWRCSISHSSDFQPKNGIKKLKIKLIFSCLRNSWLTN